MSLARLATPFEGTLGVPALRKDVLSELNTASPIYHVFEHLDGTVEAVYHPHLIPILDKVFTQNMMCLLSIDQTRYMNVFFKEAGVVNDLIDSNNSDTDPSNDVDPRAGMSDVMRQLDVFLGSYFGADNELVR